MWITVFVGLLIGCLVCQQSHAQPSICVTCVSCKDVYDGSDLNSTCSISTPNADSCQKTRIQIPGTTLVLKSCTKGCNPQSIIAGPFRLDVTCCTSSNCNRAPQTIIVTMKTILVCAIFTLL